MQARPTGKLPCAPHVWLFEPSSNGDDLETPFYRCPFHCFLWRDSKINFDSEKICRNRIIVSLVLDYRLADCINGHYGPTG